MTTGRSGASPRWPLPKRLQRVLARRRFDPAFYLARYPELSSAGIDPFRHFMDFGWREGRNPSAAFDTLFYKDRFMAGAMTENPLLHFVAARGRRHAVPLSDAESLDVQRRVIGPFFDEAFYRSVYGTPPALSSLDHFLTEGWRLGREPNRAFSTPRYLKHHAHVARLDVAPFYHCASTRPDLAAGSQRSPQSIDDTTEALRLATHDARHIRAALTPEFDAAFYSAHYADVRGAGIAPLDHFLLHGWKEGRKPTALFETGYYLAANDDVRAAGVNPFYHYVAVGRAEGRRPHPAGTAYWPKAKAPDRAAWSGLSPAGDLQRADVVVVVPVYKGYDETLAALHCVLAAKQDRAFALLVLNDRSPDAALTAELRDLAADGCFAYAENDENLGFVQTTNRGMAIAAGKDVVLLNADTLVFGDWLDRILAHADADPRIATITPLSNNATICSYPMIDRDNVVALELSASEIDMLAGRGNRGRRLDIPTGVGFCFYIRRAALDALGAFDAAAFGRGYGEENDFCLRARKAGWRNVLANDVFVYHAGRVSFAGDAGPEYDEGQRQLVRKHPDYPIRVRRFMKADPGWETRARLDLIRLARSYERPPFVFVLHSWAGGIATHVRDMRALIESEGDEVLIVRLGTNQDEDVEIVLDESRGVFTPSLRAFSLLRFPGLFSDFLGWLRPQIVHIHSLASLRWTAVAALFDAIRAAKTPYAVTLHDYFSVCHRYNLVRAEGDYCGLPPTDVCRACIRSDADAPSPVDPDARRAFFAEAFAGARHVFAPSEDVKARMASLFPAVRIDVRPHPETLPTIAPHEPPAAARPLRIAVIGAIVSHKGADVLHMMASDILARNLPIELTIVGFSDITDELARVGVTATGEYEHESEIYARLDEIRPHLALFPSIWPETFCYTLTHALVAGIPPVVFDIGAPAARLRELGTGLVLPYDLARMPCELNDRLLSADLADLWTRRKRPRPATYADMSRNYYNCDR